MRNSYNQLNKEANELGFLVGTYNNWYTITDQSGSKQYFIGTIGECKGFLKGYRFAKEE